MDMIFLASLAAMQTLTVGAPLPDRNGDGRVTLSRPMPPFKRGDVLIQCAPLVYAKQCGAVAARTTSAAAPSPASAAATTRNLAAREAPPLPSRPVAPFAAPSGASWTMAGPRRTLPPGTKWVWRNSFPEAPIDGQVIERVTASCTTTCVWVGRATTSTIIRDAEFTRPDASGPSKIDAGIKVGGTKGGVPAAGVLIERVYSHGWRQNTREGKYANGDGLVVNRGVRDVTVRHSRFDDNADGGVDTKADLTVLDQVSASGNGHYGFRFWGGARATTLYCTDNAWGCIEVAPGGDVTIDRVVMKGPQELVTTKKGAVVTIKSCDLSGWTGNVLTKGQGQVTLGEGCRAPGASAAGASRTR